MKKIRSTRPAPSVHPYPTLRGAGRTHRSSAAATSDVIAEDTAAIAARLAGAPGTSVLVSGAPGMLARYLADTLRASGAHLVKDRRIGDDEVGAPATHVDHVIHVGLPGARRDAIGRITLNTRLLAHLLDIARRHKAHLTFVSSTESRGQIDVLAPELGHLAGQLAGEALCVAYRAQHGVGTSVVRLSHVYGPGMALDDERVHARIIRATLAGEPIMLRTDGRHERTYTYVADAAEAVLRVAFTGTQRTTTEAFDAVDENGRITIRELAHATLRAAGRAPAVAVRLGQLPIGVAPEPTPLDLMPMYRLGWQPSISLPDGLERTIRWHRDR